MVRCFEDPDIVHVSGMVDPVADIEIVNLELMLADLEIINRRLPRIEKKAILKVEPDLEAEYRVLLKIKEKLQEGNRNFGLFPEEVLRVRHYNFLTLKPMIYVCNVSEEELGGNRHVEAVRRHAEAEEAGSSSFPEKSNPSWRSWTRIRELFLGELGLAESGLDKLTKAAYDLLGLATFFTHNEKEVRAWTFRRG